MKFTIKIKFLLSVIPLVIFIIAISIIAFNNLHQSLKFIDKIVYSEVSIADASMEAAVVNSKSCILLGKYLNEDKLDKLDMIEDEFKEKVLKFEMLINTVIYGSESEEFKLIDDGKIYNMWIKDGYKDEIIVKKGEVEIVKTFIKAAELHKMFKENAIKVMKYYKSILQESKFEKYIDKIEIKKQFDEIENWNTEIYFLMNLVEKRSRDKLRTMMIENNLTVILANSLIVRITILSIIIVIIIYLLLAHSITDPLKKIKESTKAISRGNYNFDKIKVKSKDEIGMLAESFNIMTESLMIKNKKEKMNNEKILMRSQKLASLGELSSSIVHEIKQPLNVIKVSADSLIYIHNQNKQLSETCKKNFDKIKRISDNSDRINKIIKSVYDTIKMPKDIRRKKININKEVKRVIIYFDQKFKENSIKLNLQFTRNINKIKFSDVQFHEVLSNILNNAINAYDRITKKNKKIIIKTKENKEFILLEVIDNAKGINDGIEEKIFDPLFSMSTKKESLGLGLFIVKKILDTNNSSIEFINNDNGGATFKIFFPKINYLRN